MDVTVTTRDGGAILHQENARNVSGLIAASVIKGPSWPGVYIMVYTVGMKYLEYCCLRISFTDGEGVNK
jgi:hypothetical protein